jgi:hypothetical protein
MRKFILKTILFSIPILASFFANTFWGAKNKGDLIRMGYLYDNTGHYRDIFKNDFSSELKYVDFSNQKRKLKPKYKIFTIGDSFSQQGNSGYQNVLASDSYMSLLHFNSWGNPFEILNGVIKGDILDSIKVDYIILQSAERYMVERGTNFDSTYVINYKTAVERDREMISLVSSKELNNKKLKLFADGILKFPLYNFLYLFDDNAFFSEVYKVKLKKKRFSVEEPELLFYYEELANVISNNDSESVNYLNFELNRLAFDLSKRGIKLIVLISPDKFDIYYSDIEDKIHYPKPIFFESFKRLPKEYVYIDTKELLLNAIGLKNDIYYFDDTHWSPYAVQIISENIKEIINQDKLGIIPIPQR